MDFNLPVATPTYASPRRAPWLRYVVTGVAITVVIIVAGWGYSSNWWQPLPVSWQAVFLTNGQVYFGHITGETSRLVILQDIFYLQAPGSLQVANKAEQAQELALVKLGNELHGPTDEIRVNREHVLFVETLKADSKVAQAIEQYRQKAK